LQYNGFGAVWEGATRQNFQKCAYFCEVLPEYAPGQTETRAYEPVKNDYSHPMDAVQYGCVYFREGLGQGDGQHDDWSAVGSRSETPSSVDYSGIVV